MSKIEDCGCAFPFEGGANNGISPEGGMTLRDYFAGQALVGMMGAMRPYSNEYERSASAAYAQADAMIAARKGGEA